MNFWDYLIFLTQTLWITVMNAENYWIMLCSMIMSNNKHYWVIIIWCDLPFDKSISRINFRLFIFCVYLKFIIRAYIKALLSPKLRFMSNRGWTLNIDIVYVQSSSSIWYVFMKAFVPHPCICVTGIFKLVRFWTISERSRRFNTP